MSGVRASIRPYGWKFVRHPARESTLRQFGKTPACRRVHWIAPFLIVVWRRLRDPLLCGRFLRSSGRPTHWTRFCRIQVIPRILGACRRDFDCCLPAWRKHPVACNGEGVLPIHLTHAILLSTMGRLGVSDAGAPVAIRRLSRLCHGIRRPGDGGPSSRRRRPWAARRSRRAGGPRCR